MLYKAMRCVIALIFAVTGIIVIQLLLEEMPIIYGYDIFKNGIFGAAIATIVSWATGIFVFGSVGWAIGPFLLRHVLRFTELVAVILSKVPTSNILVLVFGVGIGLCLANLLGAPFSRLPIVGPYVSLVLSLVFAVIGGKVALRKRNDLVSFVNRLTFGRRNKNQNIDETERALITDVELQISPNKLLDTSVIIDGRIYDIWNTGFLEGNLIVPQFVLAELQRLSDSADDLKRAKGRRGLELVEKLKGEKGKQLVIEEYDSDDISEVDAKLVHLAKISNAIIVTNDFNLNKVASIQGIKVLNINDLANAVKPQAVAGETMRVQLVREGKEYGQAIAYLEDGTMIVVENGRRFIGQGVSVMVTSVLQTSAGRMIFARLQLE